MNHLCESEIEELIKLVAKHKGDESPLLLVLARMLVEKKEENKNYIDHFLTAADYCDDMYQEEYAKVIRNTYVYPKNNFEKVSSGELGKQFEGSSRPGHFDGVLTVVNRFFELIRPKIAIFGILHILIN